MQNESDYDKWEKVLKSWTALKRGKFQLSLSSPQNKVSLVPESLQERKAEPWPVALVPVWPASSPGWFALLQGNTMLLCRVIKNEMRERKRMEVLESLPFLQSAN